jgi:hypothetical protein
MATDTGVISEGEEVISLAGTYLGLDTAIVARATVSWNFFKDFQIYEIIAKPRKRLTKLPEYENPDWKGNLEKYYKDPCSP